MLTAGSDQSITLSSVPVVQQLCPVFLSSDATNNAILHWADCVSPFVYRSHSPALGGAHVFIVLVPPDLNVLLMHPFTVLESKKKNNIPTLN